MSRAAKQADEHAVDVETAAPDREDEVGADDAAPTWAPLKEHALQKEVGATSGAAAAGPAAIEVDAVSAADASPITAVTAALGGYAHVVEDGDTVRSIAVATYGSAAFARDIAAANPGRARRGKLEPGTALELPELQVPLFAALTAFADDDVTLRDIVTRLSDAEWEAFLTDLTQDLYDRNARLLARVEMIRSTGMTFLEMARTQRAHMDRKAAETGESVGAQIATQGDRPHSADAKDDWADASPDQQRLWTDEFPAVAADVVATAPPEVLDAIARARSNGGGEIKWRPEKMGSTSLATGGDWNMLVGVTWLQAAKTNAASVHSTFLHEMIGHAVYGNDRRKDYLAGPIMWGVFDGLSPEELAEAMEGMPIDQKTGQPRLGAGDFTYMEAEIFAELYEWTLDDADSASDPPFEETPAGRSTDRRLIKGDLSEVPMHLSSIGATFAPALAEGIVRGLWRRIVRDASVLPQARQMFRRAVAEILGVDV